MPKRRSPKAAAVQIEEPGSGIGAAISRYPREFVALIMATAAVGAIFSNALFMQSGPHPAPIFATRPPQAPAVVARPRVTDSVQQAAVTAPVEAPVQTQVQAPVQAPVRNRVQLIVEIQRELTRRGYYEGIADGVWGARTDAGTRELLLSAGLRINPEVGEDLLRTIQGLKAKGTSAASVSAPRNDPIADLIAPSKRVLAIQRALSEYGYGQIKPTGAYDPETRVAIEKFERDHKLPVTGQISDRFVRELSGMTGRPLE